MNLQANYSLPSIPDSTHKGEFGKILIVGGSQRYYGAPILTALGAESAGADLITLWLPQEHLNTAKNYSLNFFLKPFEDKLTLNDVPKILECVQENHVFVIGNGLGKDVCMQKAILTLLEQIKIPVVLDAEALFPEVLDLNVPKENWILTPHKKEFERLTGQSFSETSLKKISEKYESTFLVKGPVDYIAQHGQIFENKTGCVQMRVGGTGDVLAGIVASWKAQGFTNLEAAKNAAYYYGLAGEKLAQNQAAFTAKELAHFFPKSLISL